MSYRTSVDQDLPRVHLAAALEQLTAAHVLLPIAIISVALASFVVGRRLDGWVLPIAAAVSVGGLRAFCPSWRAVGLTAAVAASTCVAAGLVASAFPDNSWDGLAYHQEAVLRLAAGWNPLFEAAGGYGTGQELYLDHYPKVSWIAAAAVLLSTGHVEAGKLFNLTLMMAATGMVTSVLLRLTALRPSVAAGLGTITGLNPVFIYQSMTFYVDNILASTLTVLVTGLTLYVATQRWQALAVALLAGGLAINVKLTGLVYVGVLLAFAVPIVLWWHGIKAAWRMTAVAAATGVVGGVLLGYAPYVRNLLTHGDPFFPATPAHGLVTFELMVPANLSESNRFTRFLVSSFSRSELVRPPQSTRLKFPLSIERGELRGLYGADIESGGFGPLYGAMLLLAGLGGMSLWARRSTREAAGIVLIIGGCVLVSMFVHRETWWARFIPQAWLLPMLVMVPSLCSPKRSLQWWVGSGLVGLAMINLLIVGANVGWRQLKYARETQRSLREMSAAQPVIVYLGGFRSLRQRLSEAHVDFQMVETPPESGLRHTIPSPGNQSDQAFWFASRQRAVR
jgi:hypothetical protein